MVLKLSEKLETETEIITIDAAIKPAIRHWTNIFSQYTVMSD